MNIHKKGELLTKEQAATQYSAQLVTMSKRVGNKFHQPAEDLLSAFYESMVKTSHFEVKSESELLGFAYTTMKNHAINNFRRHSRNPTYSLEDYACSPVFIDDAGDRLTANLIIDGIRGKLTQFRNYPVFEFLYDNVLLGQMKYETAAKELKLPVGTVKTNIWRIRELANKHYKQEYELLVKTA